jgi:hypothetical protein
MSGGPQNQPGKKRKIKVDETYSKAGRIVMTKSNIATATSADFSTKRVARLTGLLYLILFPTSGVAYGISQLLMEQRGASGAFAWIQMNLALFKLAIILGVVGYIDYLLLALAFYKLLHPVGKVAAATMLAFVAISVPVSLAAIARWLDVLSLLQSADSLNADTLRDQVLLAVHGYNNLFQVSAIFWGLWLIPLGWLVMRSGFLPRAIGGMLMLGSVFYVMGFIGPVFSSSYPATLIARIVGIASGIPGLLGGELAICLWLLIVGVRDPGATKRPLGS